MCTEFCAESNSTGIILLDCSMRYLRAPTASEVSGAISNITVACPIHMYVVWNSPGLLLYRQTKHLTLPTQNNYGLHKTSLDTAQGPTTGPRPHVCTQGAGSHRSHWIGQKKDDIIKAVYNCHMTHHYVLGRVNQYSLLHLNVRWPRYMNISIDKISALQDRQTLLFIPGWNDARTFAKRLYLSVRVNLLWIYAMRLIVARQRACALA